MTNTQVTGLRRVAAGSALREQRRWQVGSLVRWAGITLVLLFFLTPILYLVATSLKRADEVFAGRFWPASPFWQNWPDAFNTIDLTLLMRNSVLVSGLSALLTLSIAVPASYAMVRYGTGGKPLYSIVLGSYIAPPVVALLPMFYLLKRIDGIDTHWGLALIHGLASVPIAIWLLDSFVRSIPADMEEAAQIDGAGQIETLVRIVLPLMSPGIAATAIICLILSYNELLFALVMTYQPATQTLPVGIALFQGDRLVNYGQMAAASLAGVLPIYVLALVFQRFLLGDRTQGALK
ncbi:MAG: carbohydrate ABC transporter permease [Thermomicrobiales bacterium]|nr:carbohydrate ABC transporter permease [Thermomicrobiales bacterium]